MYGVTDEMKGPDVISNLIKLLCISMGQSFWKFLSNNPVDELWIKIYSQELNNIHHTILDYFMTKLGITKLIIKVTRFKKWCNDSKCSEKDDNLSNNQPGNQPTSAVLLTKVIIPFLT